MLIYRFTEVKIFYCKIIDRDPCLCYCNADMKVLEFIKELGFGKVIKVSLLILEECLQKNKKRKELGSSIDGPTVIIILPSMLCTLQTLLKDLLLNI